MILASASPRRRRLLGEAGFVFEIVAPAITEIFPATLTVGEITCWNALRKGLAVARTHSHAVVLAADTLVAVDSEIIGKPADLADARRILARLSGREHTVSTGVSLGCLTTGKTETFTVSSQVLFKKWNASQIEDYLRKVEPLDKAGAYAAQGKGSAIIARIIGSRSNVIGLPMEKVTPALARFGVTPNA
ncbi:MAG: septum formation protein Maf [Chthoniobacterales bacterium]|nr:septum formation protein Maf [Chthoniobacterales bacterium]